MNFGMIIWPQSIKTEQNVVTRIQTALLFTLKPFFFEDISNDVEIWFDTSDCDKNDKRPLPIAKNKKLLRLFKDELRGKIMAEVFALRSKAYAYVDDGGSKHKKS